MAVKLLIFDLDGTLIDSSVDLSCALNYAVRPYGIPELTVEQTIALVGEGVTRLVAKAIEGKAPHLDVTDLVKRFIDYYSDHLADHTKPYPGAKWVLEELAGYKKAVVSNKIESLSVKTLKAVGLIDYFDYVAGGDTAPEKKPSPVPILNVLSRFSVDAEEALLVGDSIYDMEAGRAAGVRTVAALYGFGGPSFSEKADYRIRTIEELPEVVSKA